MPKFLTGNELNLELERILESANEYIILISPYIKLHDRYASSLKTKLNSPELGILIVFGKNEDNLSKSMKQVDFDFFKQFPNIEIRYERRLHAKYYANESAALLTSMNLYNYSQDNNIEAGVITKINRGLAKNLISNVTGEANFDEQAFNYFDRVIEQAEVLFKKTPLFEKTMLGLSQKYVSSEIEVDKLSAFFENRTSSEQPISSTNKSAEYKVGYCIRTGEKIPFNPKFPMTNQSHQSWLKFSNKEYPEKYCHFSGEPSYGETSFARPILRKNWDRAKLNQS